MLFVCWFVDCFFSGFGLWVCVVLWFYVGCGCDNLVVCDCSVLIMCWLWIVFGFVCVS